MICAGCRLEAIGGWQTGDGSIWCKACIAEQLAIAEVAELNRRLLARPKSVAELLAARIHASAHSRGPVEGCPECGIGA